MTKQEEKIIKSIVEKSHQHRILKNQKNLVRQWISERLLLGYNGGLFESKPDLIMFVKMLIDSGISQHPIFDRNNDPVMIEDLNDFYTLLFGRYTETANDAWQEWLSCENEIEDLINKSIEQ